MLITVHWKPRVNHLTHLSHGVSLHGQKDSFCSLDMLCDFVGVLFMNECECVVNIKKPNQRQVWSGGKSWWQVLWSKIFLCRGLLRWGIPGIPLLHRESVHDIDLCTQKRSCSGKKWEVQECTFREGIILLKLKRSWWPRKLRPAASRLWKGIW